jgi:hypothetical protein
VNRSATHIVLHHDAESSNLQWDWRGTVSQLATSVVIIPGLRVKNDEDRRRCPHADCAFDPRRQAWEACEVPVRLQEPIRRC